MIQQYAINMRFKEETLQSLSSMKPNTRNEQANQFKNVPIASPDVFAILLQARQIQEEKYDKSQAHQCNEDISNKYTEDLNLQRRLFKMASNIHMASPKDSLLFSNPSLPKMFLFSRQSTTTKRNDLRSKSHKLSWILGIHSVLITCDLHTCPWHNIFAESREPQTKLASEVIKSTVGIQWSFMLCR